MSMPENTANPHNDGLAQPNPAIQADSSSESAQYNHGPQQDRLGQGHAQQVPKSIQDLLAALPEMFPGVQKIPLANIRLNPDNPGPKPTEEEIAELAANIALETLKNPIKVMPDPLGPLVPGVAPHPDNSRLKSNGTPWALSDFRFLNLSGELRQLACQRLQWTEIDGFVLNPTAEEAVVIVRLDNQVRDKGWWADYQTVENLIKANPKLTQKQVAIRLRMNVRSVNWAISLLPLLNAEARELIVSNRNNQNKGIKGISESAASRLAALGPGSTFKPGVKGAGESQALYPFPPIPPETQNLVYQTLVVACDHQMTEVQVQKLVEHIQAGNPPETYSPTAKPRSSKLGHKAVRSEEFKPQLETSNSPLQTPNSVDQPLHPSTPVPHSHSTQPDSSEKSNWFWKWMAGIKFISEVRRKLKQGEPLTRWEKVYALFYGSYEKTKPVLKDVNHWLKNTLGKKHYNLLRTVFWVILIWALLWSAGKFWQIVVTNPLHWLERKAQSALQLGESKPQESVVPAPTAAPTPETPNAVRSSELGSSKLKTSNSKLLTSNSSSNSSSASTSSSLRTSNSTSVASYQSSRSFEPAVESQNLLDAEIAALPEKVVVKNFPLQPDENMPGDVALSRMQDVADPDKYTMMIGSGKQIIKSANATNTTLTIDYKSADPFGSILGGGKSPMNFLWEDVRYIHINEIDHFSKPPTANAVGDKPEAQPDIKYQCSLVVKGAKNPLTLQCASTDDLENLVSTMEYFIRSSRLAHDAQPAGLPYPNQGLGLTNDCRVDKLWAESPMGKSGAQLGDMIWSVDKNAGLQPELKFLETQLAALTPGQHNLFIVSPSDRDKGIIEMNQTHSSYFNPKRQKLLLISS